MKYSLILISTILVGCSLKPMQGYEGPERPVTEVAVVEGIEDSTDTKVRVLSVNGISFVGRDITLLPGIHKFSIIGAVGDRPRNCVDADRTDRYRFNQCLEERRRQIKDDSPYVNPCDIDDFIEKKQICEREYRDFGCELEVNLQPGVKYDIGFYESGGTAKFYCDIDRGESVGSPRTQVSDTECRLIGKRLEREEFDGHFYD